MKQFAAMMAECARVRAQYLSSRQQYAEAQREYNEQAIWLKVASSYEKETRDEETYPHFVQNNG